MATPMLQQYLRIKEVYNDAILLFRLGDFYEMFFEDAEIASTILDITLTSRNKHEENPIPLCGVPYHSVEPYIVKLLEHGKKVAICEQVEDPKAAKGVVKREVVRIYTPGVIPDGDALDAGAHNYVAGIIQEQGGAGLAYADISTGTFRAASFDSTDELVEELIRLEPKEIIVPSSAPAFDAVPRALITARDDGEFASEALAGLEGAQEITAGAPLAAKAAGAVFRYLAYTQRGDTSSVRVVEHYTPGDAMRLDEATKRNLEILRTMQDAERRGSLAWLMDRTSTAMGARLLRRWLGFPLTGVDRIRRRHDAVAAFIDDTGMREVLADALARTGDLERLATRMVMGTGNARDMVAIARSLAAAGEVAPELCGREGLLAELGERIDPSSDIVHAIEERIVSDPPFSTREGGMVRDGVDPELDELRAIRGEGKQRLAQIETDERARTGIGSLKVRYNKVFGYYIEVTNAHRDKVPDDYIRKQTLTNAERYITPELKAFEEKVLGAEDRIRSLEHAIFNELRERIAEASSRIGATAKAIAQCDVLLSFAELAREGRYCKPDVDDGDLIDIEEGRHPVIERLQSGERFVPNDVKVGGSCERFLMITGPNMAGKSTVMRQTALIVLMAQVGSYVPAAKATIGVVDRIFTRIGASDALAKGQSTFMVEMTEAATILRESTPRSLVIIDEIGRGTSTFDGLAIAWSVAEELHDHARARTLFATHYHELTELSETREGIRNFQIAVKEWNGKVIFLRRLVPGGTSHSYGIQVAQLAGLSPRVIERAREILANLEQGEPDRIDGKQPTGAQMTLFTSHPLIEGLRDIDVTALTPIEALNLLHRWKQSM